MKSTKKTTTKARNTADDEIKRLRGENKKLHKTIDGVWKVLRPIKPTDTPLDMYGVIEATCQLIKTDMPKEYGADSQSLVSEKGLQEAQRRALAERERVELAKELGVSVSQLDKVKDENRILQASRNVFNRLLGLPPIPVEGVSEEEYAAIVNRILRETIIFTAGIPFSLKGEVKRFIDTALKMKSLIPQERRKSPPEVERGGRLRVEEGKSWEDVYSTIFPDLETRITIPRKRGEFKDNYQRQVNAWIRRHAHELKPKDKNGRQGKKRAR
jgi:hypothetical protein